MEKIEIDPRSVDRKTVYKILTGCIVPRPIGFISSVSASGVFNAAPFSFFNGISHIPPLVCFSPSVRPDWQPKDTLKNVTEVRDFVVNIVDEDLAAAMSLCAEEYPPEVSEFEVAKLTPAPSKVVSSPRILESPVNMECRVVSILPLPESIYTLVIGQVVYFHVREDVYLPDGRIAWHRLRAVGRMAGDAYTRTRDIFTLDYNSYRVIRRFHNDRAVGA